MIERPSPNFDARTQPIELVVLHYTGMQDGKIALARLTDPAPVAGRYPGPWQDASIAPEAPLSRVSAHYVVDEDGSVYQLVAESERAWHAGISNWRGRGDVNARSIGIEIVNGGHDFGLPDFSEAQIDAVIALVRDILTRNGLKPGAVVAHSDIAPQRKADPGEKFPWRRLADAGVSIWPGDAGAIDAAATAARLAAFGYDVTDLKATVAAFQRRFRPAVVNGQADDETLRLLAALADRY